MTHFKSQVVIAVGQGCDNFGRCHLVCSGVEEEAVGAQVILVVHVLSFDVVAGSSLVPNMQKPSEEKIGSVIQYIVNQHPKFFFFLLFKMKGTNYTPESFRFSE